MYHLRIQNQRRNSEQTTQKYLLTYDRIKRDMSWVLRFKQILLRKIKMDATKKPLHGSDLLQESEAQSINFVQEKRLAAELKASRSRNKDMTMPRSSTIKQLEPFLNGNGIICVGGRLRRSFLNELNKHPMILPKGEKVSNLIIQQCHIRCVHGGRGATLNELRSSGYWITSCNAAVRSLLFKCMKCRRPRGIPVEQKMAELPVHRLAEAPPFTCCGVDMFGPFLINQQRNEIKRYRPMFTCMASRAAHIEITNSLNSGSFIQAPRRIIARRGNIKLLYSDNGINFAGYENELKKIYQEMDNERIQSFMQSLGGDLVRWIRNPPPASHIGGVSEMQVKSARAILSSLLSTHGKSLDEESLLTLVVETDRILNSRSLTVETISDPTSDLPLAPSKILTMKCKVAAHGKGDSSVQR